MAKKLKRFTEKFNRGKMKSEKENTKENNQEINVEENENINNETLNSNEEQIVEDKKTEVNEPTPQKSELEIAKENLAQANDKYLRLYSEFDNFRKRTAKEKIDLIKSASEDVIKNMLPIVDDFKRAMTHNTEVDDAEAIKQGFELIFNKLYKSLETKGLKQIEAKGEVFNPDVHEAITNIPAPSKDMKGKIVDVVEEGYYLGEKIIRFPKVVVGQ